MLIIISLTIILIVSVIINIFLYKALNTQLKKINLYEQWIIDYDNWIYDAKDMIRSTYLRMRSVDDRSLFFKDDDVGFVFQELLALLKKFNERIQQ
jgi:hypothetical protein